MKIAILKKAQRRPVVWPWILIISFVVFTVAPIAVVYGLLYDPSTKHTNIQEDFSVEEMGNRIMVDALDYTSTEKKIKLTLTNDDLDNVLEYALSTAGLRNRYIKKAYAVIKDESYKFYIDLDAVILQSRIKLSTTLTESEDHSTFIFVVNDLGIGNINGFADLAKTTFSQYIPEDVVNKAFENSGLSMHFDKSKLELSYKKIDLLSDLAKFTEDTQANMLIDIIKILMNNNLASFNFKGDKFLEVDIDLSRLETNELVTDTSTQRRVEADEIDTNCKAKLITLMNNGVVDPSNSELMTTVFTYLFKGYYPLSSEEKDVIDGMDFTSIGIPVNSAYVPIYRSGYKFVEYDEDGNIVDMDQYLFDKLKDRIMNSKDLLESDKEVTLLYEVDLNNYIASRDISSYKILLHRRAEEGYKLSYILIDNFYCNIYALRDEYGNKIGQIAELVCKLNINGLQTALTFETDATVENNETLTFAVKDHGIKYGNVDAYELNEEFFRIISGSLGYGDSTINVDAENHTFTFNFGNVIEPAKNSLFTQIMNNVYASTDLNIEIVIPPHIAISYSIADKVENAVQKSLDDVFTTDNAEIIIDGENRQDEDGATLKLQLKDNDFKTIVRAHLEEEIADVPDYIKPYIDLDDIVSKFSSGS